MGVIHAGPGRHALGLPCPRMGSAPPSTAPAPPLAHDDVGSGDAVVFVHAFPFDARMWSAERILLSPRHRVITPDLRGFGRSRGLAAPRTIAEHADDVAALCASIGVTRARIVGLSMGGYVALALAHRHPALVTSLGLCDTRSAPDAEDARAGRARSIALVGERGVGALVDALLPRLCADQTGEPVREQIRRIAADQAAPGVIAALVAMRDRPDATPWLGGISVPTLVVVGSHDALTPPDEARAMAERMPDARVIEIPGAGHLPCFEQPDAFARALATMG